MVRQRFNYEWPSSSARYGPRFRLHRRLLHQVFHAKAALGYRDKQLQSAYELLTHILDDPTRYAAHFTTYVSSYAGGIFAMWRSHMSTGSLHP